jgi:hypothetical protein
MSCSIAYLLREDDGALWFSGETWGHPILDPEMRDRTLQSIRERRSLIDAAHLTDGYFDGVYCNGAVIDLPGRRYGFYPCEKDGLDVLDQRIKTAPVWKDWDAGVALGGREDFGDLFPSARRLIKPFRELDALDPSPRLYDRGDWFVHWSPAERVLAVRPSVHWNGLTNLFDVLTIVASEGDHPLALDYWLRSGAQYVVHNVLAALRGGPPVLDALRSGPPYPTASEAHSSETRHTAVVDFPRSTIHYSPNAFAPSRLLAAVAAAWPGWRLQSLSSELHKSDRLADGAALVRPRLEVLAE